jgi:hypothetical protein
MAVAVSRVLASGKGLSPNYTFYLAAPNFVKQHPKSVSGLILFEMLREHRQG